MGTSAPDLVAQRRPGLTEGWAPYALLGALTVVVFGVYGVLGTDFVLDDWFTLRNAHFDGVWAAAGKDQAVARPGARLVYAAVFGLIGRHPLPVLVVQALVAGATATVFFIVLRRFVVPSLALLAATVWIVLPNHTSLEVWASASNIAVALLLALAACLLLARPVLSAGAVAGAALLSGAAVLTYEAVAPAALAAAVALPWLAQRRPRWDVVVPVWAAIGVAGLWIVTHWHPDKDVAREVPDLTQAVGAHLGWGVAPKGPLADVLTIVGVVGIAAAVVRVALPSWRGRAGQAEWLVVAGVAVVTVGVLPFAPYLYAPLGAGDRFSVVSALGGAMVWAGIAGTVAAWHRSMAVALVVGLLAAGAVARVERAEVWHLAGRDAVAILAETRRAVPDPGGRIVLGPAPIQRDNVAAFLDSSNVAGAVQLEYDDRDLEGRITYDEDEFSRVPADERVDIRAVSELG